MQKVIIADDEEKVCQLIEKLINWQELSMEIVAIVHNGLDAYKEVLEKQPDIVITDICMPGMDGLKMIREIKKTQPNVKIIIVSGYRHFEYAQNALRYGVNDYLLKPIKKVELHDILFKMHQEYLQRTEQLTYEEKYLLDMKNDVEKIRSGFFSELLYPKGILELLQKLNLQEINQSYHFKFKEGVFQIVCIKMDGLGTEINANFQVLADKVRSTIVANLKDVCYDLEIYFESSCSYCLLNYDDEKKKYVRKCLKIILNELMQMESILKGLYITIGCGCGVDNFEKIKESRKVARQTVEQRLIVGTGKVIERSDICINDIEDNHDCKSCLADTDLFREFNSNMINALERLDEKKVAEEIDNLKYNLLEIENISGHEIFQMTKEVCNIYLLYMRQKKFMIMDGNFFMEKFNSEVENFYSVDELFSYLKQRILHSFKQAAEEKRLSDNRPIRIAKNYIQEHFASPLTLEEISEVVGFNTTYFSSLFKKETGKSYSEYLFEVRMERAKALLKGTDEKISVVCQMVGYSDVKYFTKSFIKYSGLKPKEYRKLYA